MVKDLGWEGGEQLIFIMFINIFGHNVILKIFFVTGNWKAICGSMWIT